MGVILDNTLPVVFSGDYSFEFITHPEVQGIETHEYVSVPVSGLGCTSSDSNWEITGGTAPPGLDLMSGTGILSGKIDSFSSSADLVNMTNQWPEQPMNISNADQSSYHFGSAEKITKTFNFTVSGYNTSIPSSPSVVEFTVIVLKDWSKSVNQWKTEDIHAIGAK